MIGPIFNSPYSEADAVVIGVPYGETASYGGGTENGPETIIETINEQIEHFNRYTHTSATDTNKFSSKIITDVKSKSPEEMTKLVYQTCFNENRFTLLLGGEHSISIGAIQALAEKHNPKEVTIVQLDAHFDLRDDDSDYNPDSSSKYAHSTVMRRAHELGFNILPVGIRVMFQKEFEYVTENNIVYFEWGRHDVPTPTIQQVIDVIPTEKVYITIDVDGFDTGAMPATGTPVPGGFSYAYGEGLINEILLQKNVLGADIVEVAPVEHSGLTEYAAAQLAYNILSLQTYK